MTVWQLYEHLRSILTENGLESAQLEAREIAAKAGEADRRNIAHWKEQEITGQQRRAAGEMLLQRLRGRPLAYILGEWDFYGYTFRVTPDVLIPRSDTETLCDFAIQEARKRKHPRVLDLCCGSGCIGIALAKEVLQATVVGIDLSEKALAVASENGRLHHLPSERYRALKGDIRLMGDIPGEYDLLVCNPPYITKEEMTQLDPGVKDFEPHLALFGGDDGLDFYRIIAGRYAERLAPGAAVLVECGWRQAREISAMFRMGGLDQVTIETDLTGIERVVRAVVPVDLTN